MRKSAARRIVMARWAQYHVHVCQAYVLPALAYAKQMAQRSTLSPDQQEQVRAMIPILEETARLFSGPITYRLVPKLEHANQRFAGALINLSAWDNDDTALGFWAKEILGAPKDWSYLGEVATRPLLEGRQSWTAAERPVPYLAQATRNHRTTEERKYQPRPREVPLDEVAEPIAPDSAPSTASWDELIAAVFANADGEVKAYGELVMRGCTHDEARRQLGWHKKRGQRVAVRYRRHLKRAGRDGDRQTLRQILVNWNTNASRTVAERTFRDSDAGRRYSYFEHLDGWKNRDET